MVFDTVFRETRSGRNVGQIIVLPDPDVSEPDTVSEDELDRTFQQSHSSSDDEVIEEDDASANARRKLYIWCRRPFNPKTEAFIESDEEISPVLRSIEYFRIYFTPQLLSHISFETNRKATQCLYSNLVTTVAEMEGLIGMLITMGVSEMPRYRNDNDKVVMDRSHPDYDRFYKIRSLIESIRKICLEEAPEELQSVGEYIIPYKGRCKMKYYNPRKPDKWSLKVIAGCGKMDSYMTFGCVMEWRQNYARNMQIYTGKPSSGTREKNQGMRVVLDMVKGLKGHNVTCDNFFTSYSLGVELRKKNLTLVGTVKKQARATMGTATPKRQRIELYKICLF
ncbi:PiggyBac transposable element-derived protein 2 [Trichinella patagoniensis]|uniref:PiggyBac transposable element-derived protein 2 n=1 Tax=Trichinella patagoniensis TaxID=990121 RepID=A0A0V0Z375_9BILA|nr:PiggyBac transposable element-derived protein 2 [Trichinella patagoniensis]